MSVLETAVPATRRVERGPSLRRFAIVVILLGVAIVMLYPFYYMASTSLQHPGVVSGAPGAGTWQALFRNLPVLREMANSTIVCTVSILLILSISAPAAFAFAKLTFRGHSGVFLVVIGSMMVPLQSIVIPEYVNMAHLGLVNSYLGAILVYTALGTPFSIFLLTSFYRGLPDDVVDAGLIDGLSFLGVFRRLVLRLSAPALVTVTVLQFIQIWDDLLVGLLFLQDPSTRTITVGLAAMSSGRVVSVPVLMAGSLLSALPAIAVYLFSQRYLVRGLTLGMGK